MTPKGGSQQIKFPIPTDAEGDFDGFVQINDDGLDAGNSTSEIQRLNVYTEGDVNGNATAYLVPSTGLGIISDIDDILRVTQIYEPSLGLLNTFAKSFTPWMNMPDIYANVSHLSGAIRSQFVLPLSCGTCFRSRRLPRPTS